MTKKIIKDEVEHVSGWDLDGTLKAVRDHLTDLIMQYGEDATLDWDRDYNEPYDPTPCPCFHLSVLREETDAEYETRKAKEAEYAALRLEQDRKMLAELKKKLGEE